MLNKTVSGVLSSFRGVWLQEGKIKFREDIVDNFEKAPQAFIGLFKGKNFGKLIIPVAKD